MQSASCEIKSKENKLHWIYNISWGFAFVVGGYAGIPDYSFRYVSIFIVVSMFFTIAEQLAIKLWSR
jgi:phosphomevalonate kinase